VAEIIPVRPEAPDEASVRRAADALLNGETVALPTDTVYGLCALAEDPAAIEALYKVKGRGEKKGAPVLIGEFAHLATLADQIPQKAQALINALWPGPLTLILTARAEMSPFLSESGGIAVRFPAQALCQAIAQAAGPFAATSANRPGEPPLRDAAAIEDAFGDGVSLILDGGPCGNGAPSTVVDARGGALKLLREGLLPFERAKAAWKGI
jgi:tRNA threonylcarbamoyl adenosine modification protein (Sua5/YciO/YrdC/YwlC family)